MLIDELFDKWDEIPIKDRDAIIDEIAEQSGSHSYLINVMYEAFKTNPKETLRILKEAQTGEFSVPSKFEYKDYTNINEIEGGEIINDSEKVKQLLNETEIETNNIIHIEPYSPKNN